MFRLAQNFTVSGEFEPKKASLYLKRAGSNSSDAFQLTESQNAIFDACNFANLNQNGNVLILDESDAGSTGSGSLNLRSASGLGYPKATYPIQSDEGRHYNLYLRVKPVGGNFNATVLVDDVEVGPISESGLVGNWDWVGFDFALPDSLKHNLSLRIEESGASLDKVFISADEKDPEGAGPNFTASPFCTVHLQLYRTDGSVPTTAYLSYDQKTTLDDIVADDWQNFDLSLLDGSSPTYTDVCSLVMSVSGGTKQNYIIWELVDNDEYNLSPSLIKV